MCSVVCFTCECGAAVRVRVNEVLSCYFLLEESPPGFIIVSLPEDAAETICCSIELWILADKFWSVDGGRDGNKWEMGISDGDKEEGSWSRTDLFYLRGLDG